MKNLQIRLTYYLTLVIIALIILLARFVPTENLRVGQESIEGLNDNWQITSKEKVINNSTLPARINTRPNEVYIAQRFMSEDFSGGIKLRIRSSMQSLKVLVDGKEIYVSEKPSNGILKSPDASVWHLVKMPSNIKGKTLSLVMSSPVKAFSGVVNEVYYGSGDALLYDLLYKERVGITIAILLLLLGILAIIISFFLLNLGDCRLFHLGLFVVMSSLWLLSEARVMQFFTGNRFIIGGISYMALALMPISFLLYLRYSVLEKYKKQLNIITICYLIDFFVNIVLQVTGSLGFFTTIWVTNISILVIAIYIVGIMFLEMICYKNAEAKRFLVYLSIFVFFIDIEIIHFLLGNFMTTSKYIRIGICIFFVLLASDSFRYVNQLLAKEKEAGFLRKLAFKDILTGGYNRAAFERDIHKLIDGKIEEQVRLILIDINELKLINDQYGHLEGDNAIVKTYLFLEESFGKIGRCYRLGGDEFACIIKDSDSKPYEDGLNQTRRRLNKLQEELSYQLDLAIGSDVFSISDYQSFKDVFYHVDQLMYANKKLLKEKGFQ